MEAAIGQKHPCKAKKSTKELNYWKTFLIKLLSNLTNPLAGPIRFELRNQVRNICPATSKLRLCETCLLTPSTSISPILEQARRTCILVYCKSLIVLQLQNPTCTLAAKIFGLGDFWLEIKVIIKISTHPWYPRIFDQFSWGWSKNKLKMANSKKLSFSKPPFLKKILWKFHGFVVGSVRLIDVKGIDVGQPTWPWGCPT